MTQHSDAGKARTRGPLVSSQALSHSHKLFVIVRDRQQRERERERERDREIERVGGSTLLLKQSQQSIYLTCACECAYPESAPAFIYFGGHRYVYSPKLLHFLSRRLILF